MPFSLMGIPGEIDDDKDLEDDDDEGGNADQDDEDEPDFDDLDEDADLLDMAPDDAAYERRCRKCGCTDEITCGGEGCVWVTPTLCSRCA